MSGSVLFYVARSGTEQRRI